MRIILVDDTQFARTIERNLLTNLGHEIVGEARDGLEALKRYKALRPDLVLMDINMPNMDGIESIEQIIDFDPMAKIVVCSIMGQPAYIKKAIMAGAVDFIIKPFDADKFNEIINKIFNMQT